MANNRTDQENITWFDTKDKPDGDYANPRDCTRFIKVSNGKAADMACPECPQADNPEMCAGKDYLVWDDSVNVKRCEWPATTVCISDPPEQ